MSDITSQLVIPTREQWVAIHYLSELYGAARFEATYRPPTTLRIIGGDARDRCRWFVREDGTVNVAWDPDNALPDYLQVLVDASKETVSTAKEITGMIGGGWNH